MGFDLESVEGAAASQSPVDRFWRRVVIGLLRSDDPELVRRGGLALFVVLVGATMGGLSAFVHLAAGEPIRAIFTGLYGLPLLLVLLLMRWTHGPDFAVHCALGLIAFGLILSPFLAEESLPVLLGLTCIPVAATIVLNAKGGLIWTIICTSVLAASAMWFPFDVFTRTLAWNTVIICGFLGFSAVWIERTRSRALFEAQSSWQKVEEESAIRVQAESSLRESQKLFSTLFRRAPSILILVDRRDAEILDVNDRFTQVFGWEGDEVRGRRFSELDVWASLEEQRRIWQVITDDAFALEGQDVQVLSREGELLHLMASVEKLESDGKPVLLVQAIDITDRKRTHEELEAHRKSLEERMEERGELLEASLNRLREQDRLAMVGTLAAGIAHQINNPLGAISAIAEMSLIEHGTAGTETDDRALEMGRVLEEAKRCGRIVRSILQFTRDDKIEKWVDDLNGTVDRAYRSALPYIESKGGVPSLELYGSPLDVRMSPVAIEEVVVNLMRNGIESMRDGGKVRVRTRRDGPDAVLSVEDEGPGFSEADVGRAFDPFFTTRVEEGGTGLGLSVVHGLVLGHEGRIDLRRGPGGGAWVEVRLPIAKQWV